VLVGEILKAHGIHGEVVVRSLSENPARFTPGAQLLVGADPAGAQPLVVAAARSQRLERERVDELTLESVVRKVRRTIHVRRTRLYRGSLPPRPNELPPWKFTQ